jgi:hypothetical protein
MTEQAKSAVAMVLLRTAERIRQPGGWCQGSFQQGRAACTVGAVAQTVGVFPEALQVMIGGWPAQWPAAAPDSRVGLAQKALLYVAKTIDPKIQTWDDGAGVVVAWNDGCEQTAENVAIGLELAAVLADQDLQVPLEEAPPLPTELAIKPRVWDHKAYYDNIYKAEIAYVTSNLLPPSFGKGVIHGE